MSELLAYKQEARAEKPFPWDRWRQFVTSGGDSGTKHASKKDFIRAYCMIAVLVALSDVTNVFTVLNDSARMGRSLAPWEPITWEFTSGVAVLVACGVIYAALRMAPPGRRPWALTLFIHLLASTLFSVLHVGGMALLRIGIYGLAGLRYHMTLGEMPYEYRKDLVTYLILAGVFWIFAKPPAVAGAALEHGSTARTFDIVDGNRTFRVPVHEILLLHAAGNYVEFLLESGRTHLMRTALQEIERSLAPLGFLRTHRSWIINERRVRSLRPAGGSGDFQVELEGGAKAPLSRRFREALSRLRSSQGPNLGAESTHPSPFRILRKTRA